MTKEMVDKKSQTLKENEKTIEELKIENDLLKNQLVQKEHEKEILETKIDELIREIAQNREIILEQEKTQIKETSSKKKAEIQGKKVKKAKKKEDSKVTEEFKPDGRIAAKDKIVEGTSRRKCPICGNSNTHLIREVTDKSIIILDYPKVYGKKFVCGECGANWRVVND